LPEIRRQKMTIRFSTGMRNLMFGNQAAPKAIFTNGLSGGTLAYADGGASSDTITASAGSFITAGFAPYDKIYTYGSTEAGNNMSGVVLTSVAADTITFATGTVHTGQAFAAGTVLVCCKGGSLRDVLADGALNFYTGSQPASADNAVGSATYLGRVTVSGGAWVAGAFTNGLRWGDAATAIIGRETGQTWQLKGEAAGTAGWARFVANATDNGLASTSLPRIDFSCGQTSGDIRLPGGTTIAVNGIYTLDTCNLTFPEFYGA
jgi:hypothetical protein